MDIKKFLKSHVRPATGCTEPISVGYATSLAYYALHGCCLEEGAIDRKSKPPEPEIEKIEKIIIKTDRNIYKNALSVSIPGAENRKGLAIAAAIGLYSDPAKGLNLFEGVTPEIISKAIKIIDAKKIFIEKINDTGNKADLDIQINLIYRINSNTIETTTAFVELQHQHDNISRIAVNGNTVYHVFSKEAHDNEGLFPSKLEDLIEIAKSLSEEEIEEVYKGILMNNRISEEGLKSDYGLKAGKLLKLQIGRGLIENSLLSEVKIRTAAAGDARMGGSKLPVMTTSGSGNQGILALMPVAVIGERHGIDKRRICEAAMLSHLVTCFAASESGDLSAICGCSIKAGFGAAAGAAYILGGGINEINNSINILAANITGMICDGAKESCALKLLTAAGAATESAFMAMSGMKVSPDNGIIFAGAEETIKAIGEISLSMVPTDIEIVKIMQDK
jgi:L-cysteine desulfidase